MTEKRGLDGPDKPGAGGDGGTGEAEKLEARRLRLKSELAARRKPDLPDKGGSGDKSGYGMAVKLSSEFIAGVAVGAILGFLLDHFVGTTPWGMIIFLLLGFAAGVLNVMRSTGAIAEPGEGKRSSGAANEIDDFDDD